MASRLVKQKMLKIKTVQKNINLIASHISENTPYYDWDFRVFVLDDPIPNGYACPGGIIFLTKGAVTLCENEDQIAAVIAHEMAHIVRHHGMQEISKRKVRIDSDEAFSELDEALEHEPDEMETELDDLILDSYEQVVNKRLLSYELEADIISCLFLNTSGYNPKSMFEYLKKLERNSQGTNNDISREYLDNRNISERIDKIEEFMKAKNIHTRVNSKAMERFNKIVSFL